MHQVLLHRELVPAGATTLAVLNLEGLLQANERTFETCGNEGNGSADVDAHSLGQRSREQRAMGEQTGAGESICGTMPRVAASTMEIASAGVSCVDKSIGNRSLNQMFPIPHQQLLFEYMADFRLETHSFIKSVAVKL